MRTIIYSILLAFSFLGCEKDEENLSETPIIPEDSIKNGLRVSALEAAIQNASGSPNFYALLVVKDESVVVEEYFRGKNVNTLFPIRSITKNFTSTLTGKAIEQGVLDSLDMPIKEVYSSLIGGDKEMVTVRHLLNMSSGLRWNEEQETVDLLNLTITDPIGNLLSRDLESSPGAFFNYNTLSPHIVTDIISMKSSMLFKDYAIENLLNPLGISSFNWDTDTDGNVWGGVGLELRSKDLIKFGQLYLNKGMWNGEQLIPEQWVSLSSTAQISIPNSSTNYSLQWYVADNLDKKVYFGQGFGGQALMLIPEENMMIIAFQEHLVTFNQNTLQWNNFLENVFPPIYQSIE